MLSKKEQRIYNEAVVKMLRSIASRIVKGNLNVQSYTTTTLETNSKIPREFKDKHLKEIDLNVEFM